MALQILDDTANKQTSIFTPSFHRMLLWGLYNTSPHNVKAYNILDFQKKLNKTNINYHQLHNKRYTPKNLRSADTKLKKSFSTPANPDQLHANVSINDAIISHPS